MSIIEAKHDLEEVFKKHKIREVYVAKSWDITDEVQKFYVRGNNQLMATTLLRDLCTVIHSGIPVPVQSYDSPILADKRLVWTEAGWRV